MPVIDYVPQVVRDFAPVNRFAPIAQAIYKISRDLLGKGFELLREHIPTLNNVAKAYEQSADISHIVKTTAIHNVVFYAGPIVGVKMLFAPARNYLPFSSAVFMVCEDGVLMAVAISMLISNALYNVALMKAVRPYLPPRAEYIPACDCNYDQKFSTSIANLILYVSLLAAASSINLVASPLPETLSWLLQAMAYGYSLAGLQYSAYDVCVTHSSKALNNNKAYYLSLGAMVIYTVKQTSAKISSMTGVAANFYLEDAVFSLLWQQAILVVMLQAESPDYLNNFRLLIKHYTEQKFKNYLDNSPDGGRRDYIKRFNEQLVSPLGSSLFSFKPVQLALNLHQQELTMALEWITWLNGSSVTALATNIIDKLPNKFTGRQVKVLSAILKQQDWQQTAALFKLKLREIEAGREIESVARIEPVTEQKEDYASLAANHSLFANDGTKNSSTQVSSKTDADTRAAESKSEEDDDAEEIVAPVNEKGHAVQQTSFRQKPKFS